MLGENKFVLMELSPKRDKVPAVYERVYIGEGEREVIDHVIKRLKYKELTPTAKEWLPHVLEQIVNDNQKRFLQLFNNPKGILIRPKKRICANTLNDLSRELNKRTFSNFGDIAERVSGLNHPEKIIASIIEDKVIDGRQGLINEIFSSIGIRAKKLKVGNRGVSRKTLIIKERTENLGPHDLGVKIVQKKK